MAKLLEGCGRKLWKVVMAYFKVLLQYLLGRRGKSVRIVGLPTRI
jgi:hypothetical protein